METFLYITAIGLGTLWALKHERDQNLNSDRTQSMTRKGRS